MVLKVVLRLDPTKLKAAMAATAINAAITAYSIAVTPDSLLIKLEKNVSNLVIPFAYLEYIHKLQLKALRNIKKNPRPCLAAPRAERVLCNPTYPPLTPICKPRWSLPAGGPLERGPRFALTRRWRGETRTLGPAAKGPFQPRFFGFLACGGAGPEGAELPGRTDFRIRPSAGMRILPCA
jgi:hypothetical protein